MRRYVETRPVDCRTYDETTLRAEIESRLPRTQFGNHIKSFEDGYVVVYNHKGHWRYAAYDFACKRYSHSLDTRASDGGMFNTTIEIVRSCERCSTLAGAGFVTTGDRAHGAAHP